MTKKEMDKLSAKLIQQLRVAKLDKSLLMLACGIQLDKEFDAVIRHIENNSEYRIGKTAKGVYRLCSSKKKQIKPRQLDRKTKDKLPQIFYEKIRKNSKMMIDEKTGQQVMVEIR